MLLDNDDRRQKIVLARAQHPVFHQRSRRQHPHDLAIHHPIFCFCRPHVFHLVAESNAKAFFQQYHRVAIDRMVRHACHGNAPDFLTPFLACQNQLEFPRDRNRILKKTLEKIPDAIQQQRVGIRVFCFRVMLHHRRQLVAIELPVVSIFQSIFLFGIGMRRMRCSHEKRVERTFHYSNHHSRCRAEYRRACEMKRIKKAMLAERAKTGMRFAFTTQVASP